MPERITVTIDQDKCTGCGLCVRLCPYQSLSLKDGKAHVTGEWSLGCGHCHAVCPEDAVRVGSIAADAFTLKTVAEEVPSLPAGGLKTAQLVGLMGMRRSCRMYQDKPVDRAVLEDLVKIGITAPSGTNCQKWTFNILPDRGAVAGFGDRVAGFYRRLNRMAERAWLRLPLKWIGKGELDDYYRNYYASVKEGLDAFDQSGKDLLFHGAPAVIMVGAAPGGSCSNEDALCATQNILLACETMGLGTCLVGFAVIAMAHDRSIQKAMGIPNDEQVKAVIALGHPAVKWQRPAGRRMPVMRFLPA